MTDHTTLHIGLVAYPQFTALDLLGPHHLFSLIPQAKVHIVAATDDLITSDMGLTIRPTTTFAQCPAALAVLMVPGGTKGTLAAMQDPAMIAFLQHAAKSAQWVSSVCTGSLVLAAAGLLDGYRATSHWAAVDTLQHFGVTGVHERVVVDRNRITGAGVTAGLDFGLQLVAQLVSEDYARKVQLAAEYDPAPMLSSGSPRTARAADTQAMRAHFQPFVDAVIAFTKK
jgi:cyclohexyl-isocyanide hydratase